MPGPVGAPSMQLLVTEDMKLLFAVLSAILLAILGYLAYELDQWLGVVAFTLPYLTFCAITGLLYWAAWFRILRRGAILVGLAVCAILSANFLLPPPSERILRSVLLRLPPGTSSGSIQKVVAEEYEGTGYALPQITIEATRVHITSLSSQRSGNCTALILQIKDDVVVSAEYSED